MVEHNMSSCPLASRAVESLIINYYSKWAGDWNQSMTDPEVAAMVLPLFQLGYMLTI